MLDDLKLIHNTDSKDLLGRAEKLPAKLVKELGDSFGEHDEAQHEQITERVQSALQAWLPTVPSAVNAAKQLALECMGRPVVLYTGPELDSAGHVWKLAFNRYAKQLVWQVWYPQGAEDDLLGWSGETADKFYTVIELRSSLESPEVAKTFAATKRLLSGLRPEAFEVWAEGESRLEQLAWIEVFGEFVSLYLAILNGQDPAKTVALDKFKELTKDA